VIVQKAFKYRFFPTDGLAARLTRTFGCARYVYNRALKFRSTAWCQEKKSLLAFLLELDRQAPAIDYKLSILSV
jgi:transposase